MVKTAPKSPNRKFSHSIDRACSLIGKKRIPSKSHLRTTTHTSTTASRETTKKNIQNKNTEYKEKGLGCKVISIYILERICVSIRVKNRWKQTMRCAFTSPTECCFFFGFETIQTPKRILFIWIMYVRSKVENLVPFCSREKNTHTSSPINTRDTRETNEKNKITNVMYSILFGFGDKQIFGGRQHSNGSKCGK